MAKPSLLIPGCEQTPTQIDLSYKPAGGVSYKVQTGDDWWKLASRSEVKAAGMDALGLCRFNFQTEEAPEINWYLRNKVGCSHSTLDRKNYVFTSDASPGIVYLPSAHVGTLSETKLKCNSWIGVGLKFGSTVVIDGIEQMGGMVVSIQDLINTESRIRTIILNAQSSRFGLGAGASGGLCLIYVTSLRRTVQLNSLMTGGWDFSLAIGANAGSLIKGCTTSAKLKRVEPLVKVLAKIGARSPEVLSRALRQSDKLGDLYNVLVHLRETLKSEDNEEEPEVIVVDLPFSGGTEGAIFKAVTTFRVLGEPTFDVDWPNS